MSITPQLGDALGHRVRDARRTRGWSQKELAARAGLSVRFLGQVESGQANVSLARLGELAQALGVSFVSLLAGTGPVHDGPDRLAARYTELGSAEQQSLLQAALQPDPEIAMTNPPGRDT